LQRSGSTCEIQKLFSIFSQSDPGRSDKGKHGAVLGGTILSGNQVVFREYAFGKTLNETNMAEKASELFFRWKLRGYRFL
jgi:hypothetical protein